MSDTAGPAEVAPRRPSKLKKLWARTDRFVLAIAVAAVIGTALPASGVLAPVTDWGSKFMIAGLFLLYGARLAPRETLAGLKHWRLHVTILLFTFAVFPLIGVALRPIAGHLISNGMYVGLLYLCLVPSTVQSSINFTSIAGGNVAGAIVSASTSNLLGVFTTPALVFLTMGLSGAISFHPGSILDTMLQILLPFIIGQFSRRWTADFVHRNHHWLKYFDQGSIVLIVYSAFSASRREDIWSLVSWQELAVITCICVILLAAMLWLTWHVARWLRFTRADQIAIQFCGTKKSLATGVPMATVLFPATAIGLQVLPLIIFHMVQLIACGWLAAHYGRKLEKPNSWRP